MLTSLLESRFPDAKVTVDQPSSPENTWWIDVDYHDHSIVVEYRPGSGFGVSSRSGQVYGEQSDELYPDVDATYHRIVRLLLSGSETKEPRSLDLKDLRRIRNLSQIELADQLKITQSSVSRLERREDVLVGTLGSLVSALGGELEIRALFSDQIVKIILGEKGAST